MSRRKKIDPRRPRPSISQLNRTNTLAQRNLSGHSKFVSSFGALERKHFSRILPSQLAGVVLRPFKVIRRATGLGVYLCREQILDATEWDAIGTTNDKLIDKSPTLAWNSETEYAIGNFVSYSGNYFVCKLAHTNQTPPVIENTYWKRIFIWGKATLAWSGVTAYVIGDRVIEGGKHYICINDHTNHQPPNVTYWWETYVTNDYIYIDLDGEDIIFKCISTHVPTDAKKPPHITYWLDAFIQEVLNCFETRRIETTFASNGLALHDYMMVWQMYDDEGNIRYVGFPIVDGPRRAQVYSAPDGSVYVECNLILTNGVEAAEGELGYRVKVFFDMCGDLESDAASPRLAADNTLLVIHREGRWRCSTILQSSVNSAVYGG